MFKKQFFIFGASGAYGVGGTSGGWAGLIKNHVHERLYGANPMGEVAEVYAFAKPGAVTAFVRDTFQEQLKLYTRGQATTAFISVGLNDTRAVETPTGFVSNEVDFTESMTALLGELSGAVDTVVILGFIPVDESKLTPKINPMDGRKTYFFNNRIAAFNALLKKACGAFENVHYVNVSNLADDWTERYLFKDGLHPNDAGHRLIFEKLKPFLEIK